MAEPITNHELRALFAPALSFKSVVLAVSGGSDSMALLLLMRRWAGLDGVAAPEFEVVTVDHGLRASSADEARQVAMQSQRLGFHHTTKVWAGEKEDGGLQARARAALYRLHAEVVADRNFPRPTAILTP